MNDYNNMGLEDLQREKRSIIRQLNSGKFEERFDGDAKKAYGEAEAIQRTIMKKQLDALNEQRKAGRVSE